MKTITEKRAEQWRQELLAGLIDLAESNEGAPAERRRKAVELIEELKMTDRMLSSAKPAPITGDYSGCGEPSEAVAAFLRRHGKPATEDEIIDGVFEGGFRGGDRDNHRLSVDLAIRNRLTGTGRNHDEFGLKGDIRGLIGLKEWDSALFS